MSASAEDWATVSREEDVQYTNLAAELQDIRKITIGRVKIAGKQVPAVQSSIGVIILDGDLQPKLVDEGTAATFKASS